MLKLARNKPVRDEWRLSTHDAVDRLELSRNPHEGVVDRHDSHKAAVAIDYGEAAAAASALAHASQGFLDRSPFRNDDGWRGHDVRDSSRERVPSLPEHPHREIAIGEHPDRPIELVDHHQSADAAFPHTARGFRYGFIGRRELDRLFCN